MSFGEKSAWAMVGIVLVAYGWYVTSIMGQFDGSVVHISYQQTAGAAAIAVVVLAVVSNTVLAATSQNVSKGGNAGTSAIKRYARSIGGVVITAAAVLAMALAMAGAEDFWIANVILAGLVVGELATAGSEILIYRRDT